MSSRNCESCLGTGEKPSMGHMHAYKCRKCAGSGIIHIHTFGAIVNNHPVNSDTVKVVELNNPLSTMAEMEQKRLLNAAPLDVKKRGRPPKTG